MTLFRQRKKRPKLSCVECRRRKLKCNREEPCGRCIEMEILCSYKPADYYPRSRSTRSNALPVTPNPSLDNVSSLTQPSNGDRIDLGTPFSRLESMNNGVEEDSCTRRTQVPSNQMNHRIHSGLEELRPRLRGIFSKDRLFGPSNWMTTFDQYNKLCAAAVRSTSTGEDPLRDTVAFSEVNEILKRAKFLARLLKSRGSFSEMSIQEAQRIMPSSEVMDILIRNFINTMEIPFRVLHIPSFIKQYSEYCTNPQDATHTFITQLLLILSIGARFCEDIVLERQLRWRAYQWVLNVQSWIMSQRLTISNIQTQCLLLLAQKVNAVNAIPAHIATGTLLQSAMYLGLHRDPIYLPKVSIFQAEMRRRLWLTIVELHVQAALDVGMVPIISSSGFDTRPPLNIDDNEINETTLVAPPSKPLLQWTQMSFQILLQQSLSTRIETLSLVNDAFTEPSYNAALALSSKLVAACRSSDHSLCALGSPPPDYGTKSFYTNLLNELVRRFLVSLHRPFVGGNTDDPRHYYSRKVCTDNALALLSPESDHYFRRLLVVGQGQFRESFQLAAVTLCVEMLMRLEENSEDPVAAGANKAIQVHLLAIVKEIPALVEERFKFGETNVKGYVYLKMAIAQIEATDAGLDPKPLMMEAAKVSASHCLELLDAEASTGVDGSVTKEDSYASGMGITPDGTEQWDMNGLGFDTNDLDLDVPRGWLFPDLF